MANASRDSFPASQPRGTKRDAGATELGQTPLSVRAAGVTLSRGLEDHIRKRLGKSLGKIAHRIERLTVRFEDINGPRGGVDIVCRVKAVLSGIPSIVVSSHAETDRVAFDVAVGPLTRAIRSAADRGHKPKRGRAAKPFTRGSAKSSATTEAPVDAGSLIGRRVGRSAKNLAAALERPEKKRGDAIVDTAAVGVSATDRKAGGTSTARRNSKARTTRATATLEDSQQARPSRKSTRKSANRTKSATNLQKRAVAATQSPKARATRAKQ